MVSSSMNPFTMIYNKPTAVKLIDTMFAACELFQLGLNLVHIIQ